MNNEPLVFSGNANRLLAQSISDKLLIPLGSAKVGTFSDGETRVEIDENVRGKDVFIVQPTCPPVNNHVMELLILIDAMKRASADRITAVIPYYGYARQDRKVAPRAPISAKLVADLITAAGADRILTMDLHAGQIQGFFNIPVDNLFAQKLILEHISKNYENLVMVSPDTGGAERVRSYAKKLGVTIAIIDKRRDGPNESEVMNIIGNVKGKRVVVVDDMIDTAGTLVRGSEALMQEGAVEIIAAATHAILSGQAITKIAESEIIKNVIVTDTIPLSEAAKASSKFSVLGTGELFARSIKHIHNNDSVRSLFI